MESNSNQTLHFTQKLNNIYKKYSKLYNNHSYNQIIKKMYI